MMKITCLKQWVPVLMGLLILMILSCPRVFSAPITSASANPGQQLAQMEQQLFSHSYDAEKPETRLARIETTVFGATQGNLGVEARILSLKQFFQPTPQPVTPITQTPQQTSTPPQALQPAPLPSSESQYPVVSAMEQRVFHQTFEQDTLENRLGRLENRTLGRAQQGALQERSDQLRMMILGETDPGIQPLTQMVTDGSSTAPPGMASTDLMQALPNVEKRVLHKTYPQDSPENRVGRLEMKLFNATAPEMSLDDRFYRITGVVMAQKSARQEQMFAGTSPMSPLTPGYGGRMYLPGRGLNSPYSSSTSGSSATGIGSMLLMILMSMF